MGGEQGRRTKETIVKQARALFIERGYEGTSVVLIAKAAAVSTETIYDVFGTKRRVLEAVIETSIAGSADEPPDMLDRSWVADLLAVRGLDARIRGFARHTAKTLIRTGPRHAAVRAAAASDPQLADLYGSVHKNRFHNQHRILQALAGDDPAFDLATAAETFSALASPELHDLLTKTRGWSPARYSGWLERIVHAAILGTARTSNPH